MVSTPCTLRIVSAKHPRCLRSSITVLLFPPISAAGCLLACDRLFSLAFAETGPLAQEIDWLGTAVPDIGVEPDRFTTNGLHVFGYVWFSGFAPSGLFVGIPADCLIFSRPRANLGLPGQRLIIGMLVCGTASRLFLFFLFISLHLIVFRVSGWALELPKTPSG